MRVGTEARDPEHRLCACDEPALFQYTWNAQSGTEIAVGGELDSAGLQLRCNGLGEKRGRAAGRNHEEAIMWALVQRNRS